MARRTPQNARTRSGRSRTRNPAPRSARNAAPDPRRVNPDGSLRRLSAADHARMVELFVAGKTVEEIAHLTERDPTTVVKVRDEGVKRLGLRPARELVAEAAKKIEVKTVDRITRMMLKQDGVHDAMTDVHIIAAAAARNLLRPHIPAINAGGVPAPEVIEAVLKARALMRGLERDTATTTRARLAIAGLEAAPPPGADDPGADARRRLEEMTDDELRAEVRNAVRDDPVFHAVLADAMAAVERGDGDDETPPPAAGKESEP